MTELLKPPVWHVDAGAVALDEAVAARPRILDGDEIVQLTLKPSLWYVPIASLRVVAACVILALLLVVIVRNQWTLLSAILFAAFVLTALIRIAIAALHWASRVYILTNRRIMRCSGILSVRVSECPLRRISDVSLHARPHHAWLGLGTLRITPADVHAPPLDWQLVARPADVLETVRRAVRRAQFDA